MSGSELPQLIKFPLSRLVPRIDNGALMAMELLLDLDRRQVADGCGQALVVEPVNPVDGGELDRLGVPQRASPLGARITSAGWSLDPDD